jgi:hypothetical protein
VALIVFVAREKMRHWSGALPAMIKTNITSVINRASAFIRVASP